MRPPAVRSFATCGLLRPFRLLKIIGEAGPRAGKTVAATIILGQPEESVNLLCESAAYEGSAKR